MKKISKVFLALMMAFGLTACGSKEEAKIGAVKILCPTGAPGIALASVYEEVTANEGKIDFCDGTEQLIANLTNANSEYDVIVAPINLGGKLIASNQTDYRLKGVITWGNLYLVGTSSDALTSSGEIALFGMGAVPAKIYAETSEGITLTPEFYESATDVQQKLLSGQVQVGMLAEPAATATIGKAKENNLELSVLKDLQATYGENGYPQAAVFVKGDVDETLISKIDTFTNNGYENLETLLDTIGIETFKLPATKVVVNSIERQNIHYKEASACKEDISKFLGLFNIEFNEDMLSK